MAIRLSYLKLGMSGEARISLTFLKVYFRIIFLLFFYSDYGQQRQQRREILVLGEITFKKLVCVHCHIYSCFNVHVQSEEISLVVLVAFDEERVFPYAPWQT